MTNPIGDFLRQLRTPGFRRHLTRHGYYTGLPVAAAAAGTPWVDVLEMLGESGLLARQCQTAPYGWELLYMPDRDVARLLGWTPGDEADHGLVDATGLRLIRSWPTPGRYRAWSIAQHHLDSGAAP